MKFFKSVVVTLMATFAVVQAAPARIPIEAQVATMPETSVLIKKENLANALYELQQLQEMKVKRNDLSTELSEREYAIVTQVLTLVKDTDLAPTVLKFFVENDTLKNLATNGLELVIRSKLISLDQLFNLLVKSGLVTTVLEDVLSDCDVYVGIIDIAKSLLGSLLKREDVTRTTPYSYEEGMELLRRDGLIEPTVFDTYDHEKRDLVLDDIIVNLLDSLGKSGLASQVVETILTDPDFLTFGAQLLITLYKDGLLNIPGIILAAVSSGLLSQLIQKFLNIGTISTIVRTAIDALDGKCSGSSSPTPSTGGGNSTIPGLIGLLTSGLTGGSSASSGSSSGSSSSGLISGLLGSVGLGSLGNLLGLLGLSSSASSSAGASSSSSGLLSGLLNSLGGNSTSPTSTTGVTPTGTDTAATPSGSGLLSNILGSLGSSSSSSSSSSASSSSLLSLLGPAGGLLGSLLGGGSGNSSPSSTSNPCATAVTKRERLLLR